MPTYEYKCLNCDRRFDVFQNMTDEPLTECSVCHGKLKRLIGAGAGVIFKGSGFYATDYRSDSYKTAAKSDKAPPASTGGSSSSAAGTSSDGGGSKTAKSTDSSNTAKGAKT